jgi:hypothetical protein
VCLDTPARQAITESAAIAMISGLMMAEIHQLQEHDGGLRFKQTPKFGAKQKASISKNEMRSGKNASFMRDEQLT